MYLGDPSPEDRDFSEQIPLPGYFIDANGIKRYGPDRDPRSDVDEPRCAY